MKCMSKQLHILANPYVKEKIALLDAPSPHMNHFFKRLFLKRKSIPAVHIDELTFLKNISNESN